MYVCVRVHVHAHYNWFRISAYESYRCRHCFSAAQDPAFKYLLMYTWKCSPNSQSQDLSGICQTVVLADWLWLHFKLIGQPDLFHELLNTLLIFVQELKMRKSATAKPWKEKYLKQVNVEKGIDVKIQKCVFMSLIEKLIKFSHLKGEGWMKLLSLRQYWVH